MALRWCESWDSLVTGDLTAKYDSVAGAPTVVAGGRTGSNCLQCTDGNTNPVLTKVFDAQPVWIVGFALKIVTISANDKPIVQIVDNATAQVTLNYQTGTGKLYLTGAFGTSALTAAGLSAGVWYYVELKCTINNGAGSYELKVDGTTVIGPVTGVDTSSTANNSADRIAYRAGGSGGTSTARQFDDCYICDGTGSAPTNDFLGDCKVECIRPNGNGNSSQLVGNDGNSTDNYLLVDETTQNGDTDYVESATVGNKDTYTYGDLSTATGTVYGVQINPYARKTDAGARTLVSVRRLSGTEVDGSSKTLSTTYLYFYDVSETKPGGGAWTIADVNSAEFGVKVNS